MGKFKDDAPINPVAAAMAKQAGERWGRCKKCFQDEAQLWGTLLSRRDIMAELPDGRRVKVARVDQCLVCGQIYTVKMFDAAGRLDIFEARLEQCIRCRGSLFSLEELQTGHLRPPSRPFPAKAEVTLADKYADPAGGTRQPEPPEPGGQLVLPC